MIIGISFLMLSTLFLITSPVEAVPPSDHLTNPSPSYGEDDVVIGPKGVQTCIDLVLDGQCTVNLTFQWFNYTGPYSWWGWETYGYSENVAASGTICYWNDNVSCATENYWSEWFNWRVMANFTCPEGNYTEIMYSYFNPEDCALFLIYPEWNATDVCPCSDAMCIGIDNENGNPMNLTFYRNDSRFETFYIVNKYNDVDNGTYCFCIDGHLGVVDKLYYPMRFNETYHWYVNIIDTVTNDTYNTTIFSFITEDNINNCGCENVSSEIEALEEENILEELEEENNMIISVALVLWILAIILFLIAIIMEVFNEGEEAYDNAVIIIFVLAIIMFFVAGATFYYTAMTSNELYLAHAWVNFILGILAVSLTTLKVVGLLDHVEGA